MFKYFHLCTHEVKENNDGGERRIVKIKNDGTKIDVLIQGATVLKIEEVRIISFDKELEKVEMIYDEPEGRFTYEDEDEDEGFYDDPKERFLRYSEYFSEGAALSSPIPAHAYEPYVHNRIKWNVNVPTEYEATIYVKYQDGRKQRHEAKLCPHCQGKGWFVDILNNHGRFELDIGIEKITQRILKDLLTDLYSSQLDNEYGTLIRQIIATQVMDDERLFDDIRMIISEVEDEYLARQTVDALDLSPEETFRACTVSRILRAPFDPRKIIIELKIQTDLEAGNFQFVV